MDRRGCTSGHCEQQTGKHASRSKAAGVHHDCPGTSTTLSGVLPVSSTQTSAR